MGAKREKAKRKELLGEGGAASILNPSSAAVGARPRAADLWLPRPGSRESMAIQGPVSPGRRKGMPKRVC